MTRSKIPPQLSEPMWRAFRRHCHRLLALGYQEALPKIRHEAAQETDITNYICDAMDDCLRTLPDGDWLRKLYVKDDPHVKGAGRTGKNRLKADIIIGLTKGARPEFVFEAKPLHRKKARASRYRGKDGMGCFIGGRYASEYTEAAMIGYVQSDTLEYWQATLQEQIEANAQSLELDHIEKQAPFPDLFPLEWSSSHRRKEAAPVKLFHILLDCRKSENTSPSQTQR
ncbi:MAG: hypothetical protein HOP19_18410 [Acidobacteria bacterium]|nr:hypothetical protein [Acidobacteriota bacterium]